MFYTSGCIPFCSKTIAAVIASLLLSRIVLPWFYFNVCCIYICCAWVCVVRERERERERKYRISVSCTRVHKCKRKPLVASMWVFANHFWFWEYLGLWSFVFQWQCGCGVADDLLEWEWEWVRVRDGQMNISILNTKYTHWMIIRLGVLPLERPHHQPA